MTARKLPMPGVRDRLTTGEGGESAGAEAAAAGRGGAHPHEQQRQNGYPAAAAVAAGEQGRGSNSSRAGLGPSIMQPLPLASRYAGAAAKQDTLRSSSAALGSSWIRRFLPSTGELGKEATTTHVPAKAVLGSGGATGGGGGESGSQPAGPLLLTPAPNEHKEQQQEEAGGRGKGRMGLDSCIETSVKVAGNGNGMQKGKAPVEKESGPQEMATSSRDVGEIVVRGGPLRKVITVPSQHPYVVEGSSRLQQQQQLQGNHRTLLSTRGESDVDGNSGAKVTGFGPLRVVMKAPTRVQSWPKLKGMEGETRADSDVVPGAAAQPDARRLSTATLLPDRNKPIGTQTMASQTGMVFTPASKSRLVEDPWSGRPSRAVEFASAWGFPRSKKQEVELDARPSMAQPDGAARETVGVPGGLNGGAPPATRFNPFGEGNFQYRLDSGHQKMSDHEGGVVERMKLGSNKFSERFVSSYLPANLGRKEEGGQGVESRLEHSRGAEEATARPNHSEAGFPAGIENRKMKEVIGCGFSSRRQMDTGGPSEQQQFQEIPPYSSHQFQGGDICIGKIGHPLPFSPHSSFPGEDNSGEDTRNSRGRADRPKSPLTTPFGSPKPYEDELDGRAAQSQQDAPWTSLFAAFKGQNQHPEPANSCSSTPTLPPDVRSRLQDGSNRPVQGSEVNGDQDDTSGRNDAHLPASPEARSRFDNQSSHFSNSPWLDEENHIPNDEAGSGPYNSQATGSGFHSQASRVANRSKDDAKRKHMNAYRYGAGGGRDGFGTQATRESSASEPDLRKFVRNQGEDQGPQTTHEENQAAHRSHTPLEYFTRQAMSGHKDDTSGSSPPSYPRGYNSLEMGSSMLPRGIIDEHLLSIAGKLRKVEVDSEVEGIGVPRMQKGYRKERVAFAPKRPMDNKNSSKRDNEAVYRDHMDVSAFPQRDTNHDVSRYGRSNERLEPGMRHGKLRTSGEAMGEGGISGPSKRTRHHRNLGASNFGSQVAGSGMPSSWLKRWLPPSTGNAAKSSAGFVRPKDNPRNGEPPPSNGNGNNFMRVSNDHRITEVKRAETARGKEIDRQGNETKARNGMTDVTGKRGLNGMPSHPIPSAAAMALVGTAARKIGSFPQQRKGSVSMWPPVHLQAAPEGQRPQRSELSS